MKDIFRLQNSSQFLAKFLLLRYQVSLLVTARDLWWKNHELLDLKWGCTIHQWCPQFLWRLVRYHPVTVIKVEQWEIQNLCVDLNCVRYKTEFDSHNFFCVELSVFRCSYLLISLRITYNLACFLDYAVTLPVLASSMLSSSVLLWFIVLGTFKDYFLYNLVL
jgi:hypothetical protein